MDLIPDRPSRVMSRPAVRVRSSALSNRAIYAASSPTYRTIFRERVASCYATLGSKDVAFSSLIGNALLVTTKLVISQVVVVLCLAREKSLSAVLTTLNK
jgi:hypothetical protein